ncbi:hypothetical protein Y032_0134g1867 [Ancylostoma ceylanicum]|uniref:DNA-directed RNA polymerase III subunit RPC10 n=1 Tax=Ancylostoma ceylanicum TaxID=53326 RepID=A0A016T594_9BILA|nr:hypothetical protein Y032_0134g1867 [Ancylostoma ceylanicum]
MAMTVVLKQHLKKKKRSALNAAKLFEVTNERCPKCSHERAYFMQIQTRSADEPMTIFYRCANADCCHRWKD